MTNGHAAIDIAGTSYPITLPDFATREDIALAWYTSASAADASTLRRVAGAAVGLCSPVGRRAGASFDGNGLLLYGGKVYGWMREQGMTMEAVLTVGSDLYKLCADSVFPREAEVEARASFSDPNGGSSIA